MSASQDHDQPAPKRRRRRLALSCEQCRVRKTKCDRAYPCKQCVQARSGECTYSSHTPAPANTFVSPPAQASISVAPLLFSDNQTISNTAQRVSAALSCPPTPQTLASGPAWESWQGKAPFGSMPGTGLEGTVSKTRLFGQSHWMHSFGRLSTLTSLKDNALLNSATFKDGNSKTEILALLKRCKSMAKSEKMDLHEEWLQTTDLKTLVPPRQVSDALTSLYFSTGETIYRILHFPTFQKEYEKYWVDPSSANLAFIIKMLLAMASGAIFYQESDSESIRSEAKKWIFAGHHWFSHLPTEKSRLNISGLQIHCLLILARQAHGVVGDLAWISAGDLIRVGFNMGLHRDPKFFPKMSQMQGEMRRRLWATIIEINVQLSLDMGVNPLLSAEDYDTEPPGNFNDIDLDDSANNATFPKPSHVFTQSTFQRVLLDSLALRLRVCRLINDFRGDATYDTVLELGAQLTKSCKDATLQIQNFEGQPSALKVTQLQRNILDISIRRFLFLLHGRHCMKAFTDPRYYFSRKVCLDIAILMATYPTSEDRISIMPLDQYPHDQHTLMKIGSADFFKRVLMHCAMTIFHHLLHQIEEESDSNFTMREQGRRAREPLNAILKDMLDLVAARIPLNASNVKCHLFMSAVMGQLEALEKGVSPEVGAVEGAKKSARTILDILDSREPEPKGAGPPAGISRSGQEILTPIDTTSSDAVGIEDWNFDLETPESWLFAGWEDDRSW